MRLALAAVLALATVSAAAQTEPMQALPPFNIRAEGNFRPPQTSAVRATFYAVAATGALVAVGYVVDRAVAGAIDPTTSDSPALEIGHLIMAFGVIGGPMAGNLSLGAGEALGRSAGIKATGITAGGFVIVIGLGASLGCVFSADCLVLDDIALGLIYGGAGIMAAGVAVGAVVDFVTIPASARWAQRVRANGNREPAEAPRVSVTPGYDVRRGAPMLALRVGL